MSIVANSITFPDVPSGVTESYPYICVTAGFADGIQSYYLICTSKPLYMFPYTIYGSDLDMLEFLDLSGNYKVYNLTTLSGENTWEMGMDCTNAKLEFPLNDDVYYVMWSNFNILKVTSKNDDGTYTAGDEVYFARNDYLSMPYLWYSDMAEVIRFHKNSTKKYKPEDFAKIIKAMLVLPSSEAITEFSLSFDSNAAGILPTVYKATATSTLSGMSFTTSATGVLTE